MPRRGLYDGAGDLFNTDELANRMAKVEFGAMARSTNSGDDWCNSDFNRPGKGFADVGRWSLAGCFRGGSRKGCSTARKAKEYSLVDEVDKAKKALALLPADKLDCVTY